MSISNSPIRRACFALALALALGAQAAWCAGTVEERVDEIVGKLRRATPEDLWSAQRQLVSIGAEAVPALKSRLAKARPPAQLAIAKALCALGQPADVVEPLIDLIRAKRSAEHSVVAANILGEGARDVPATEENLLRLVDDRSLEPDVSRAVARALYFAATSEEVMKRANGALRRLLTAAADPATRVDCALSLAEIQDLNPPVDAILKDIQDEPTPRGRLAHSLLENGTLRTLLLKTERGRQGELNDMLLNEVKQYIQKYHVEEPVPDHKLVNAAARGMVAELNRGAHPDRHSAFFDEDEWKMFREHISGHYGGIGAVVQFVKHFDTGEEPVFTCVRPTYNGPAYRAGIRSYDRIVEINGQATSGKKVDEIVKNLRGDPGTPVELTITHPGSADRSAVKLQRADIDLPSVRYYMLPGKIGYVHLSVFNETTSRDLDKAMTDLERRGMVALILDLRGNPGGQLNAAVDVANLFLKDNKLIVYTEGRNRQIAPREEFRTRASVTHPGYPMVVLVNAQSASASEIVAGALQEHRRAILIGVRTYGKGSVQKLFPLRATAGQSGLKLTIAKYYLPSGRSIHGKGVEPDVEIPFELTFTAKEFEHLREKGALFRYTQDRFARRPDLFARLAEFDNYDGNAYPDFDEWCRGLGGEIGRDKARRLLRAWLRIQVADVRGAEFVCDIQEDNQLQQAVIHVAKRVPGLDTRAIAEYRTLSEAPPKKAPPQPREGDHPNVEDE